MIQLRGWSIALVLFATIASGCFVATDVSHGHDVSECDHVQYFLPVPTEQARRFLPPGFAPANAADVESRPGWDGKALVYLDVVVCAESEIEAGPFAGSTLALAVERPQVADEFDVARVDHEFYTIVYWTDGSNQLVELRRTGYHAVEAQISIEPAAQGFSQRSEVVDDEGIVHFEEAVFHQDERREASTSRFWHAAEAGWTWSEIRTPARPTHQGPPSDCTFRDGSLARQLIGDDGCDATEDAAVYVPDQAWDGAFHFRALGHALAPPPSMDG